MEDELPDKPMKIDAALRELNSKPLINLWPTAAVILDVSRSEIYAMAARGEVEVLPVGRLRKAITAPLRKKLKLESAATRLRRKGKGVIVTQPAIKEPEPMAAAPSSGFVDFILHRLHVAALRAKIVANEIEATATALHGGFISPEAAILILAETGIEVSRDD